MPEMSVRKGSEAGSKARTASAVTAPITSPSGAMGTARSESSPSADQVPLN
jgi:hypothetical protein